MKDSDDPDPFAALLASARESAKQAESAWLGAAEDGGGLAGASSSTRWREVVRLLEALSVAAKVSRRLHHDCVQPPSRDVAHYYNVDVLHGLLMQQLESLETGITQRQQKASAVPTRHYAVPVMMEEQCVRAAFPSPGNEEEEPEPVEGGSCTIA